MYPIRRQMLESLRAARMPRLAPGETHRNRMRTAPWDIDPLGDLNNGRIITLSDVGRIGLAHRLGLVAAMRRRRWGIAMAGSAPQYRKRSTMFQPVEFLNRLTVRDARFLFIEQTMLTNGLPSFTMMTRTVITAKGRAVPTEEVMAEIGAPDWNPPAPQWALDWAAADSARPWPPPLTP